MTWWQIARVAAELAIDLVRGKLGSISAPAPTKPVGLPYAAVAHQQAQAKAGARRFDKP